MSPVLTSIDLHPILLSPDLVKFAPPHFFLSVVDADDEAKEEDIKVFNLSSKGGNGMLMLVILPFCTIFRCRMLAFALFDFDTNLQIRSLFFSALRDFL